MSDAPKVLVIDDDPDIQAILRTSLERDGFKVVSALDAMQGPMLTRKESPALVILDIMMPAGGGAAVFQRLRQNTLTAHIPILIYSAVPVEQVRRAIPDIGQTPVLTKPQDLERLTAEVKTILRPA